MAFLDAIDMACKLRSDFENMGSDKVPLNVMTNKFSYSVCWREAALQ